MPRNAVIPHTIPRLDDEAFSLDADADRLWVVQLWTGFSHNRAVFCRSVNDQRTDSWPGTVSLMKSRFNEAAAMLARKRCTIAQARDWLERTGRRKERRCAACEHLLPLGFLFCTHCGLPGGGQADIVDAACTAAGGGSCHQHAGAAR